MEKRKIVDLKTGDLFRFYGEDKIFMKIKFHTNLEKNQKEVGAILITHVCVQGEGFEGTLYCDLGSTIEFLGNVKD